MNKKTIGNEPIYDARTLGAPRMLVLGFQHMFAMFGATVLVPTLTGLSVSTTLLFAGCSICWPRARSLPSWAPASPSWAAMRP